MKGDLAKLIPELRGRGDGILERLFRKLEQRNSRRNAQQFRAGTQHVNAISYENLEARQLLAADVLGLNLLATAPNDTGVIGDEITSTLSPTVDVSIAAGTAMPGDFLELRDAAGTLVIGGTFLGAGQTSASFVVPAAQFAEGANTFTAFVTGVEDTTLTNNVITRDTATTTPTITTPIEGDDIVNATEDNDVLLTGTAEAGSTVDVSITDGINTAFATVTADPAGGWTLLGSELNVSAFTNGTLTVTADSTDVAGNISSQATATITLDNVTTSPVITTSIEGDDVVNAAEDGDVLVTGTAEAGSSVDVTISDGTNTATTTVTADAAGAWTIAGSELNVSAFLNGTLTVTADATDVAGNTATSNVSIVLDNLAPATPVITTPIESDDIVNAAEDGDVLVTGTAEANSSVVVVISDGTNSTTVTVTADPTGVWSILGNEFNVSAFTNGPLTISAAATDAAGNTGAAVSVNVTLDNLAPAAPVITTPIEGDDIINAAEDGDVLVAGTAEANSSVVVTISDGTNSTTVTVTADPTGVWTIAGSEFNVSTFTNGPLTVSASATDVAGNTGAAASVNVTLDNVAPTVTINQGVTQSDSALGLPVVFDVVFSDGVTGFDPTDIDLSGSTSGLFVGAPVVTVVPVGTSTTNYTVTVDGTLAAPGTVVAAVVAGGAIDGSGNGSTASTSTDNSVTLTGRSVILFANDTFPLESADNSDLVLTNNAQFEVQISDVSSTDTVVTFTIDPSSTATLGADYLFGNQVTDLGGGTYSVTIAANTTSETFDIDIVDDLFFDPAETIKLVLTNSNFGTGGLVLADPSQNMDTMTIRDNETGSEVSVAATDPDAIEGAPLTTNTGEFTISVSSPFDVPVSVVLDVSGTADFGSDYLFGNGTFDPTNNTLTVTIAAGQSSVAVTVNPNAESALVELDETVILTPSAITGAPAGVTVDNANATVTIEDDDSAEVTISSSTSAGAEGGTDATVTFTLSTPASTDTDVTFTLGGTADVGDDYDDDSTAGPVTLGESLTVTIPANTTSITIPLGIIDDNLLEDTETVEVVLDQVTGADDDITVTNNPADSMVELTIADNDSATVSIAGTLNGEETNPVSNGQFVVTLSTESATDIWVPFEVTFTTPNVDFANLTPPVPSGAPDYTFGSEVIGTGTATDPYRVRIPAGETSAEINILVNDETIVEIDETVELTLIDDFSSATPNRGLVGPGGDAQVTIGNATDTITIFDEDRAFVIVNSNIDNAFEGGANGQWTVTLALPGTTSAPGGPVVPVVSSSDTVFNYTILPGLTSNPASLGDVDATVTPLTGTFTILAGQSTATLDLGAFDDGLAEGIEDIIIRIGDGDGNPNNDIISGDSDVSLDPNVNNTFDDVFIIDNDEISVTVTGTQDGAENNGGAATPGQFTFDLNGPALQNPVPITVNYVVSGTATVGLDHALTSGSVVIDPAATGLTSATISVPVLEDALAEGNESVVVTITSIAFTSPAAISADATPASIDIIDDDAGIVTINAIDQFAGEGSTNPAYEPVFDGRFEVNLSSASPNSVVVNYSIIFPGTFGTPHATEGADFTALPGSVTILPNQTTATIDINSLEDFLGEDFERVVVRLDSVSNPLYSITSTVGPTDIPLSGLGDVGSEAIGDRDYVLIAPDQTVQVSATRDAIEGTLAGVFTVSLERPSSTPTVVTYDISVPIGGGAIEGSDFATTTSTVVIPAGSTSAPVLIDPTVVGNDTILENPEDVVITLTAVTNVAPDAGADIEISTNPTEIEATLTIYDDDFAYVTIDGVDGKEGLSDGVFTVTLRDANGDPTTATEDVVVNYSVGGTATQGVGPANLNNEDYAELSGTVTILAGSSTADVIIDINDDSLLEGLEDVTLTLDSVSSALLPLPGTGGLDRVFVGALGGPVISFQQGTSGYFGAEDTFVRQGDPITNFSSDLNVQQDNDTDGNPANDGLEQGLLRFNNIFGTGFGTIPIGSAIDTASLTLNGIDDGQISLHNLLTSLNFSGITYANALANGIAGIQADGIEADATSVVSGFLNTGFTPFDVTQSVAAWSAGQSNFGWAIFDQAFGGPSGSSFFSSETGTVAPELVVTLDTSATIHICDNESAILDIVSTTNAAEETTDGIVTVMLSGADLPVGYNLVIPYTVGGGGTATPGSDYAVDPGGTTETGQIVIVGGTDSATFDVNVLPDFLIEGTENVDVSIGTPFVQAVGAGTTAAQATAIGNVISVGVDTGSVDILDNDGATLEVSLVGDGTEGPAGPSHSDTVFRISLSGTTSAGSTSDQATTVSFTINTDLTAGSDYIAPTVFTATIPAFASFVDLEIDILDDLLNEIDLGPTGSEFITLTLTPGSVTGNPGISVSTTNGSLTDYINDDDDLVADIAATDNEASEVPAHPPATVQNDGEFTISLNLASDAQTTVPFVVNGGGTGGIADLPTGFVGGNPVSADYTLVGGPEIVWETPTSGYAVFGPSTSPQSTTIQVIATQDFDPTEGNELVTIDLVDSISLISGGTIALDNPNRPTGTPDNVGGAGDSANVTIVDEGFTVGLDNTDSPALEDGLAGSGFNGQFTVSISNKTQTGNDVTVAFQVVSDIGVPGINNGSSTTIATYGEDYVLTAGTVGSVLTIDPASLGTGLITGTITIPGGQKEALIDINVIADNAVEGELDNSVPQVYVENVPLTLTSATSDFAQTPGDGGNIALLGANNSRTESIIDDDNSEVKIQVIDDNGNPVVTSGNDIGEGATFDDGAFRFSLNAPVQGRDVVITYSIVASGSTADSSDHAVTNGTIVIPAGSTFADVAINPVDDVDVEGDETLQVVINLIEEVNAGTGVVNSHGMVGPSTMIVDTATIRDNDVAAVTIQAIDNEATEDGVQGQFKITLSQPSQIDTIVFYTVGGGIDEAVPGAAAGTGLDYEALSGFVTIPAGQTMGFITVEAFEDIVIEGDESVTVTLDRVEDTSGNVLSLFSASGSDQVFIRSNDTTTAVLTTTSDAFEQNTVAGVYTVTIDRPADVDLTFDLVNVTSTGIGFATEGADFSTTATVVIPAGQLSGTVTINPVDDSVGEGSEVLNYQLDTVTAGSPFDFVIVDAFGNIPTVNDFVSLDTTPAALTIFDNDTPTFTVNDVSQQEGTVGTSTIYTFTVTHSGQLASNVDITPSLALTSGLTVGGPDFAFPGAGAAPALTFTPGDGASSTQTFNVEVFHDNIHEADEEFTVTLNAATTGPSVDVTDTGVGTILNDDFVQYFVDSFQFVNEGTNSNPYVEGGTFSTITFTIAASNPVDVDIDVDVDYADIGGSFGAPAATGVDFASFFNPLNGITDFLPFGTDYDSGTDRITFNALDTSSLTVTVQVVQDDIVEGGFGTIGGFGSEEFQTVLSSPDTSRTGKTFVDDSGFIDDGFNGVGDSATVTVTASDPNVTEGGNSPFGDGVFTFTLDAPVQTPTVISYSVTVDGAAGDPDNDIANFATTFTGTITIPANATSIDLPFSTVDDLLVENNEAVAITITGINTDPNVGFSSTPAIATIQDNDSAVVGFTVTDNMATEGGDTAELTFTLSQKSDTATTFTLDFDPLTSAASNADFTLTLPDGTVINSLPALITIPADTDTYVVTLTAVNDSLGVFDTPAEPFIEDLNLFITGPVFGDSSISIGPNNAGTVFINDDGDGVKVNVIAGSDAGEPGVTAMQEGEFIIQLTDALGNAFVTPVDIPIVYNVGLPGDTATEGVDYDALPNFIVIPAGSSSVAVTINVQDDFDVEPTETVSIEILSIGTPGGSAITTLSNGEMIMLGTNTTATLNILDNDSAPVAGKIVADSFNVVRGVDVGTNSVSDLLAADNSFLSFNPGFVLNSTEAPVWIEFTGNSADLNPSALNFEIDSRANTPGLTLTLEVFNFATGAYEVVGTKAELFGTPSNTTSTLSVDLTGNLADFVDQNNGNVSVRAGWRQTGFTLINPWRIDIDRASWTLNVSPATSGSGSGSSGNGLRDGGEAGRNGGGLAGIENGLGGSLFGNRGDIGIQPAGQLSGQKITPVLNGIENSQLVKDLQRKSELARDELFSSEVKENPAENRVERKRSSESKSDAKFAGLDDVFSLEDDDDFLKN